MTLDVKEVEDNYNKNIMVGTVCPICGQKTLLYCGRCGTCQSCGYNSCGM